MAKTENRNKIVTNSTDFKNDPHLKKCLLKKNMGFPGGSVVKNPPANAEDTGPIPGLGRSHVPWSNYAHEPQLLNLCSKTWEPQLLSP